MRPPLRDGLRLAVGTLTVLPVHAPGRVDARVAGTAMVLAVVPGALLGALAAAVVAASGALGGDPLVSAVAAVGAVALATRGLHLDGLADTADGLAAAYDRSRALAVMRRGDTGPAGVVVLVLVLLAQVVALAAAVAEQGTARGAATACVAVLGSRAVLAGACARGVPAARPEGLGSTVAGTVPRTAAVAVAAVVVAVAAVAGLPVAVLAGWVAAAVVVARCVRRLGGVTGDVLGAAVETALTATLVVATLWARPA
ncbi:MAG: adenosylcobinamide-GDP ribazoletransferase [Actinomycetes bacterium]